LLLFLFRFKDDNEKGIYGYIRIQKYPEEEVCVLVFGMLVIDVDVVIKATFTMNFFKFIVEK